MANRCLCGWCKRIHEKNKAKCYLLEIAVVWVCQGMAVLKLSGLTTSLNPEQWSSVGVKVCNVWNSETGMGIWSKGEDTKFFSPERAPWQKGVRPSLWREMNARLCISSAQAQQRVCGHYTLAQSRPVSKSCKAYKKVWYQEEKKGIRGLFFKLIIQKGCSGLMCKEEKLGKYLEGKSKIMHRNKLSVKDLRTG